eukprot:15455183-Alexandrium_andersonii.AAC.1
MAKCSNVLAEHPGSYQKKAPELKAEKVLKRPARVGIVKFGTYDLEALGVPAELRPMKSGNGHSYTVQDLSLIHISEPTRLALI